MSQILLFVTTEGVHIESFVHSVVPRIGQQIWFNPEIMAKAKLHPDTKL